jgi:hypothetical protein
MDSRRNDGAISHFVGKSLRGGGARAPAYSPFMQRAGVPSVASLCVGLLSTAIASGCAHLPSVVEAADEPTLAPARPDPIWVPPPGRGRLDGKSHAARIEESLRCEQDGRPLLQIDPREAWAWLKGCVRAGRFTELRSLLDGPWDALLRHHPEAPSLIARIVAERGGDVETDLQLLRARRIPLFTVEQALADPDSYRGQLVLVRARVTARSRKRIELEPIVVVSGREPIVTRAGAGAGPEATLCRRPPPSFDVGTGARLVARTPSPERFLAPDDVIVALARFDALTSSGDGEEPTAELTLLDWHRPHPRLSF